MRAFCRLLTVFAISFYLSPCFASAQSCEEPPFIPSCDKITCCRGMGGVSYCDSSAGRYVCSNGYYSACYCTRHAIMDLQKIEGCCLWQGGVFTVNEMGLVVCNNGGISETCSFQSPPQNISNW